MLKSFAFLSTVCALFSCSNNTRDVNLQKVIKEDTSSKVGTIIFAEPQVIDSSHIIIYPLINEKTTSVGGFSSGSRYESTNYWNLLFYNTETNQQHLLTQDKKILISSIAAGENSSAKKNISHGSYDISKDYIFYEVIAKDYDENDFLDNKDPTYLFISDKQGNNFRQLSLDNYNIISWTIVKGTSKIILQAQKDDNNDKRFDGYDTIIPMIVDVSTDKLAKETFSQNYIDSLKIILTKTWKTDKK